MKFKNEQGIELEYTSLQDRLIKAGFDKGMLDKDESLITYRHNPKAGLIGTLKVFVLTMKFQLIIQSHYKINTQIKEFKHCFIRMN